MRKAIAAALVVAAGMAGALVPAAPVHADTERCVARKEYRRVDTVPRAHTKGRVHRIFDINGRQIVQGGGLEYRAYNKCGRHNRGYYVGYAYRMKRGAWVAVEKGRLE